MMQAKYYLKKFDTQTKPMVEKYLQLYLMYLQFDNIWNKYYVWCERLNEYFKHIQLRPMVEKYLQLSTVKGYSVYNFTTCLDINVLPTNTFVENIPFHFVAKRTKKKEEERTRRYR